MKTFEEREKELYEDLVEEISGLRDVL